MPIAVAALRNLCAGVGKAASIHAMLRPQQQELARLLNAEGCEIVFTEAAADGMGHSLAAGVAATAGAAGWLVALADMPFILPATPRRVLDALRGGAALAAACLRETRGHPVAFAPRFRADLLALSGDAGARSLLAAHADLLVRIATDDPGVLRDIDLRADLSGLEL